MAETVCEAHALPLGFRMVRSDARIHSLGRFRIGGVAYYVWAFPPNAEGTDHMRFKPIEHRERGRMKNFLEQEGVPFIRGPP